MNGDVPRRPSYGVYISQLIRFAKVCSHIEDFNARNKCLTANLLKQVYRYHKLRKAFSKFYRRHHKTIAYELLNIYLICLFGCLFIIFVLLFRFIAFSIFPFSLFFLFLFMLSSVNVDANIHYYSTSSFLVHETDMIFLLR